MNIQHNTPCPKCNYLRQESDTAPPWQCPRCGVAYAKSSHPSPRNKPATTSNSVKSQTKSTFGKRFKTIRIAILMTVLVLVGADTWLAKIRTTSWEHPLRVVVYPINGDGSMVTAAYIASLTEARFDPIERRLKEEAMRYGITLSEPIDIALSKPIAERPPLPPSDGKVLNIMLWSLKLRAWAFSADNYTGPAPHIRAFALYYDPAIHPVLAHSTGLEKGRIGVINIFAASQMAEQDNVVMLHELLHTLGATDKYDLATNQPIYPDGYAEPDDQPRLPQTKAEIMAGRIPISETRAEMPTHLDNTVIGDKTAREIGWRP